MNDIMNDILKQYEDILEIIKKRIVTKEDLKKLQVLNKAISEKLSPEDSLEQIQKVMQEFYAQDKELFNGYKALWTLYYHLMSFVDDEDLFFDFSADYIPEITLHLYAAGKGESVMKMEDFRQFATYFLEVLKDDTQKTFAGCVQDFMSDFEIEPFAQLDDFISEWLDYEEESAE